jgi:DNA-directed RNA polymerase specialized sigma24 family protein
VTGDQISRARAGDGDAFRELTEPYRRELLVHCYRMLGSFQDAEDALQDTLLSAWKGLGGFEGRASLRTWLGSPAVGSAPAAVRALEGRGGPGAVPINGLPGVGAPPAGDCHVPQAGCGAAGGGH